MFFSFAILYLLFSQLVRCCLGVHLDHDKEYFDVNLREDEEGEPLVEIEREESPRSTEKPRLQSVWHLLFHARFFFACLTGTMSMINLQFIEPILSVHLKNHFKMRQDFICLVFIIPPLTYLISVKVFSDCMPGNLHLRCVMLFSLLMVAAACLFIGPTLFFDVPGTFTVSIGGLIGLSFFNAFATVLPVPEMI